MDNKKEENEKMKASAKALIDNLHGFIGHVKSMTESVYKNSSPEDAKKFASALKNAKIDEHLKKAQSETSDFEESLKNL